MEQIIEVVVACEQVRADRQNLALGVIVLGAAVATGAAVRAPRARDARRHPEARQAAIGGMLLLMWKTLCGS